jgi:hypothetical protein
VVQNTNVEKKALEGENKKMRKFMRQSVISPGGIHINSLSAGSGTNSSAVVDLGPEAVESSSTMTPFLTIPSFEDDN